MADGRVTPFMAEQALQAFIVSSARVGTAAEAMTEAIEAALLYLTPAPATLPEDTRVSRAIATIQIGGPNYLWRVVSDCGVVKIYSSRDGCLFAMNSARAGDIAEQLHAAMVEAAESVERASRGGVR